jgi:hypothetical protein
LCATRPSSAPPIRFIVTPPLLTRWRGAIAAVPAASARHAPSSSSIDVATSSVAVTSCSLI